MRRFLTPAALCAALALAACDDDPEQFVEQRGPDVAYDAGAPGTIETQQPMLQRWAVEMPPVVALVAGVSFALVFGLVGVLFAVPLALVTMILVGKLYMEDALGQKYRGPGADTGH